MNFCARTVISPDPNLGINEVGIPVQTAKELTVPIRVTSRNREQLRQMILRGPDVHPGVNYIIRGDRFRVRITDRTKFIWAGFRCLNLSVTQVVKKNHTVVTGQTLTRYSGSKSSSLVLFSNNRRGETRLEN